jgi:hypothetical protein
LKVGRNFELFYVALELRSDVFGVHMNEHYNEKEAMSKLKLYSVNAFRHLARKYPHVFVIMNPRAAKDKERWYDKAAVDKFAAARDSISRKEENT